MSAATALTGRVERYISAPRDKGFAILAITLPGGKRAKVCGEGLAGLAAGQTIDLTGRWTTHPRFGPQFRAVDVRAHVPEEGLGLRRWLAQAGIPGVGEATAGRLVDAFGRDTVARIAEADPLAVEILGPRFPDARRSMIANRAEATLGPILAEHDVGPALRAKIFEKYGSETAQRIASDPYALIVDVDGVAFATADRIARASGIGETSDVRMVAAVIDSLRCAANDGHTALDHDALAAMVRRRTGADEETAHASLAEIDHPRVVATTVVDRDGEARDALALRVLDQAEETIARRVLDKLEQGSVLTRDDAVRYVAAAEGECGITLNPEQRAAARMALRESFSILAGGPGTGKSTILKVICLAWRMAARDGWVDERILLAAPTGKAGQRMKETTGIDASTMHRMLEVDPETGGFRRDEHDPLEAGFVAIDETSMTDVQLGASFARAWGRANVLLVGDPDQLKSVGAGRMLGDLLDSGAVPTTRLVTVRRQAEGSAIAEGAKAIREGRMPVMEADTDLMFIEMDDEAEVARAVSALHAAYLEDGADVQVLTPGHASAVGTAALNERLQADAAIDGPEIGIGGGCVAREGDKVMQVQNDSDACVWNGDAGRMGRVDAIRGEGGIVLADREVRLDAEALQRLALGYALTIHKSQGSEFGVVIIPMTDAHRMMHKRSLFYTGLTRARTICIVIGSRRAVERAVATDDGASRTTTLAHRLRAMTGA